MKVLLINPAHFGSGETPAELFEKRRDLIAKGNMYVWPFEPPLGLASLIAFLRREGVEASLLDLQAEDDPDKALGRELRRVRPDLVGFTVMTTTFPAALALAARVKRMRPWVKVVFGGPHPTIMPSETLGEPSVDFVVQGEGEYPLARLVKSGSPEGIPGLWYKRAGRVIGQGAAELIPDLNALPTPDYGAFPAERYIRHNKVLRSMNGISMIVSRGCPYRCSFCGVSQTMGTRYRIREPEMVVSDMRRLKEQFGIEGVWFKDSIFNLRKDWISRFCAEIRRTGLDLKWQMNTRVDLIEEGQVREMAEAGLEQIDLGVESGSPRSLKTLCKDISIARIEEAVRLARRHVRLSGFFMIGIPGETHDDIDLTFDLARRLDLDRASWSIFTPLPGSQLYADLLAAGKVPDAPDWTQTHFVNAQVSYADIPHHEVKERFEEIQAFFTHC